METPQECPHCHTSLADPSVPDEMADYRDQFTMAYSTDVDGVKKWLCPVCRETWPRAVPSRKMERAAKKRLAKVMRRNRG